MIKDCNYNLFYLFFSYIWFYLMDFSCFSDNLNFKNWKFSMKCFECKNPNAEFMSSTDYEVYICGNCRIKSDKKIFTSLKEKAGIFYSIYTKVKRKEENLKLFLNESNNQIQPGSLLEKSLAENEVNIINTIDRLISELSEIKSKIKTKAKNILNKNISHKDGRKHNSESLENHKKISEKLNKISDSIKNDSCFYNELDHESIKDSKNIQFFFKHNKKYIERYIMYVCELKELKRIMMITKNIYEDNYQSVSHQEEFFHKENETLLHIKVNL